MTASAAPTIERFDALDRGVGLGALLRLFVRHPSPCILGTVTAGALGTRVALGGWSWTDALTVAAVVALWPFAEWTLHRFALHARPRTVARRRLELPAARNHRLHHLDPRLIRQVYSQTPTLLGGLAVLGVLLFVAAPSGRLAVTAAAATAGAWLTYEWTHFLVHSPYRPRTRAVRALERNHRLHHYKNEGYWFGITWLAADRILGTLPDRADVETSPTARTLAA